MLKNKYIALLILTAALGINAERISAQGIYRSGRRDTTTGRSVERQRWGTPNAKSAPTQSSNRQRHSSSPDWTLRHPPSNRRHYAPESRGRQHYTQPPSNYSYHVDHPDGPHRSPHSYGRHPGHNRYRASSRYTNPYDLERLRNNHPYSYGFGYGLGIGSPGSPYGSIYPPILAPPVVVPYGSPDHYRFHHQRPSVIVVPQRPFFDQNAPLNSTMSPGMAAPPPEFTENGEPLTKAIPDEQRPLNREFKRGVVNNSEAQTGTIQRIRSLRSQTAGDRAFGENDYAVAEAAYRTATDAAPERQAPWVRLAWAQVALQDFPEAVVSLKTALRTSGDSTRPWISGEALYGLNLNSDGAIHGDELWDWLQEQPNSTDRLLLVSAFQHLRGHFGVGRELLELASQKGLDIALSSSLETLTTPKQAPPEPLPEAPDLPLKDTKEAPGEDEPLRAADDFNDDVGVPLPVIDMPEIIPEPSGA